MSSRTRTTIDVAAEEAVTSGGGELTPGANALHCRLTKREAAEFSL